MPAPTPQLCSKQAARLRRFDVAGTVDVHCHILPGVDDGPQDLPAALELARELAHDGLTDVIATPHQLGRWDRSNSPANIRAAVATMQRQLDSAGIPLRLHPGAEVRLDERIPKLLRDDEILTLGDRRRHLLAEFPPGLMIDPQVLLPFLSSSGVGVVLAHAERYAWLVRDAELAEAWTSGGAALQVNAESLLDDSGEAGPAASWLWLENGWLSLVATDAHGAAVRRPRMSDAIEAIVLRLGEDVARRVCINNPSRILAGQALDHPA